MYFFHHYFHLKKEKIQSFTDRILNRKREKKNIVLMDEMQNEAENNVFNWSLYGNLLFFRHPYKEFTFLFYICICLNFNFFCIDFPVSTFFHPLNYCYKWPEVIELLVLFNLLYFIHTEVSSYATVKWMCQRIKCIPKPFSPRSYISIIPRSLFKYIH